MNQSQTDQLMFEMSKGEEHRHAWKVTVEPFFREKASELFSAFQQCASSDKDVLFDIKLQLNVLNSLETYFKDYIETGRMASIQLKEGSDGH